MDRNVRWWRDEVIMRNNRAKKNPWASAAMYANGGEVDEEVPDEQASLVEQLMNLAQEGGVPAGVATGGGMGALQPIRDLATSDNTEGAPPVTDAPPVPATPKESQLDIRGQLQKYLESQHGQNDHMQQLADLYKDQMAKENNRPNMSNSNALADYYWGTNFSKANPPPMKESEQTGNVAKLQDMVNKGKQSTLQDLLKQYGVDTGAVGKEQANYYRTLSSNARDEGKLRNQENKDIADFRNGMFMRGRGASQETKAPLDVLNRASRAVSLMDSLQNGKANPSEMSNIASALAGMVSGSNVVTDTKLREILPSNVALTADGIRQWIMSEPRGADQTAFLERFRREVAAEAAQARKSIYGYQDSLADSFDGTMDPGTHQKIFKSGRGRLDKMYYNPDADPVLDAINLKMGIKPAAKKGADGAPPKRFFKNKKTGEIIER